MKTTKYGIAFTLLLGLGLGCENSTGPADGEGAVSLSFTGVDGSSSAVAAAFGGSAPPVTQSDGTNVLVIDRVQIVLREVELEREDDDSCASVTQSDDDGCEEFETGPMLIDLPLGDIERTLSVNVPAGRYDEIEFDIHQVGDDPEDLEFLALNPDFDDISIRVDGTWNGSPFVYTSDIDVEQEIDLPSPLTVDEGTTSTNLTIRVDLTNWFRDATGGLVDPATGANNGVNEELIEDNIEASFEAFEDDDEDGEDDDDS